MNDDKKPHVSPSADATRRAPTSLDLPKSAVKDITPSPAEAPSPGDLPAKPTEAKSADGTISKPVAKATGSAELQNSGPASAKTTKPADPEPAVTEPVAASGLPTKPSSSRSTGAVLGGAVAGGIFGILTAVAYGTLQAPPVTVADPRLVAIEKKISDFQSGFAARAGDAEKGAAALKALESRASALEQKSGTLPPALDERLKALDNRVSQLREQTEAAKGKLDLVEKAATLSAAATPAAGTEGPRVDLAPVAARIVKLEQGVDEVAKRLAGNAEAATTAATALGSRIQGIEKGLTELKSPKASDASAAILAISGMIRTALDGGAPVDRFVTALDAIGVSGESLKPLASLGAKPAPRLQALAELVASLGATVPKPVAAAPKEESLTDKLRSGLINLVEVRPAGQAKTPDGPGAANQARTKTLAGDLEGAIALINALPADQGNIFKPFVEAATTRINAVRSLNKLEADALQSVARKN